MCLVVHAAEQRFGSFPLGLNNTSPPIRICLEFREIPAAELVPLAWIVAEPLSQFCARSYILKPIIHLRLILPNPSGPQSVNKKSVSVFTVGGLARALYFDHRLHSLGS
jgi:hypothetical protein